MIIVIYGPDTFRSKEKLNALKDRFRKEVDPSGINVSEVEGKSLTLEQFQSQALASGFLARKRMIIVRNLLSEGPKDVHEQIIEIVEHLSQSENIVIFWEAEVDKRLGLWKALSGGKYVYEFAALDERSVQRWITERVTSQEGRITGDACRMLAALVGSDLWRIAGEVDKLVAYKGTEVISEEDIREMVKGIYEENIFALVDAMTDSRDVGKALRLINHELTEGMNPIYLNTMLARQFRILLQLKGAMAERKKSQADIAREFSLHPFVVIKSLPQAERFTVNELVRLYQRIGEIDVKLKSTKIPAGVLFDLFVMEGGRM